VAGRGDHLILDYDAASGGTGERTILGGLKTKDVDVVVTKNGIGPCVAISMKGTLNAFRNLTNRMEEAVGDCTNLHIAYPALVYGFWHVLRANRAGPSPTSIAGLQPTRGQVAAADVALLANGETASSIQRYHHAMAGLSGRSGVRDDPSRYEAIALTLVDTDDGRIGEVVPMYPPSESPLLLRDFFHRVYQQYDLRFVYQAPALELTTRRVAWNLESPALKDPRAADLQQRMSD
jgi:hypothetical protein